MAASTAPIATMHTYLMHKATTSATEFTLVCPIKSFPDLGGEPERVDVTSLSDRIRHYTMGVDMCAFAW